MKFFQSWRQSKNCQPWKLVDPFGLRPRATLGSQPCCRPTLLCLQSPCDSVMLWRLTVCKSFICWTCKWWMLSLSFKFVVVNGIVCNTHRRMWAVKRVVKIMNFGSVTPLESSYLNNGAWHIKTYSFVVKLMRFLMGFYVGSRDVTELCVQGKAHMGQVTKLPLSCYLVLLSIDSKTRKQDSHSVVTWPILCRQFNLMGKILCCWLFYARC